jgi:protein TonB
MVTTQNHPFFSGYGATPSRRYAGLVLVVLIHIIAIYGLLYGLSISRVDVPPPVSQIVHVDAPLKPTEPVQTIPNVTLLQQEKVFVPTVEIPIAPTQPTNTTSVQSTPVVPEQTATTVQVAPQGLPVRVEPGLDRAHSGTPIYPAISRRMGEQGSVTLQVLVGPDGQVQDVKVLQSSGFGRLDNAAIDAARNHSTFKAGSLGGKPEAMWFLYRYRFDLQSN